MDRTTDHTIRCAYCGICFTLISEDQARLHLPDGTEQPVAATPERNAMFAALDTIDALLDGTAETSAAS